MNKRGLLALSGFASIAVLGLVFYCYNLYNEKENFHESVPLIESSRMNKLIQDTQFKNPTTTFKSDVKIISETTPKPASSKKNDSNDIQNKRILGKVLGIEEAQSGTRIFEVQDGAARESLGIIRINAMNCATLEVGSLYVFSITHDAHNNWYTCISADKFVVPGGQQ